MKVLFLDVDGVLNTSKSKSILALSRPKLRLLNKIVDETGCEIVLSSTWRKVEEATFHLIKTLRYRGLRINSYTPIISTEDVLRGDEIRAWLINHPEVEKYAIVDDNSDFHLNQLPHLFQTDMDYGLTNTIAYRIIYHLNH